MDAFLARLGVQAANYAMRCGIALTSTFALQQCTRLLKTVDNKAQHAELQALQKTLDNKIKIISPALDLIEFRSGRGNVFLGNAVTLAKALQRDIVALGKRLESAAAAEELVQATDARRPTAEQKKAELLDIIDEIKTLLARIDGDIPLVQLAITASGESLSTSLPATISPSRLLQSSMFLMVGDTQFANDPSRPVQIGPSFTLSLYMLFLAHSGSTPGNQHPDMDSSRPYGLGKGERKPIWQEVLHKSRARLCRTPLHWKFDRRVGYSPPADDVAPSPNKAVLPSADMASYWPNDEYAYNLEIIEDLDDGRAHDDEYACGFDSIRQAGIRESVPIHQISKIFYTDTGRILNMGSADDFENNPVLLLKRDIGATSSSTMQGFPSRLDDDNPGTEECEPGEAESSVGSTLPEEQDDIDRQLREESEAPVFERPGHSAPTNEADANRQIGSSTQWQFPQDLDPEWLALEVFVGDHEQSSSSTSDADDGELLLPETNNSRPRHTRHSKKTSSVDSCLVDQLRNISVSGRRTPTEDLKDHTQEPSHPSGAQYTQESADSFAARSPFGTVTSSLSLLEMLIRLTSLQEFQQTSHLSIPDHILTFFLEETSTTGLRGEARWQAKQAAKQRVGFDPYTDTPTK